MKTMMRAMAATAVALTSLGSVGAVHTAMAASGNLFTNPGFESTNPTFNWTTPDFVNRISGWTANSTGCESAAWLPADNDNVLHWEYAQGQWSGYSFPALSGAAVWLNECGSGSADPWISQTVTVQVSNTYRVTGYVRTGAIVDGPLFSDFRVCVDDCIGENNLTVSIPNQAADTWLPFSAEFTASSDSATIKFVGEAVNDSDYVLDDVAIFDTAAAESESPDFEQPKTFALALNTSDAVGCELSSVSGIQGTWIQLPDSSSCTPPNNLPGASLLGWSTNASFPVEVARQQISEGWGAVDETFHGVRMIFIPAGSSTLLSGDNTLHAVWGPST